LQENRRAVVADDYFGILSMVLSHNLRRHSIASETIRAPTFDKDEVARQKDLLLSEISAQELQAVSARSVKSGPV
jgi:hypothetical protein